MDPNQIPSKVPADVLESMKKIEDHPGMDLTQIDMIKDVFAAIAAGIPLALDSLIEKSFEKAGIDTKANKGCVAFLIKMPEGQLALKPCQFSVDNNGAFVLNDAKQPIIIRDFNLVNLNEYFANLDIDSLVEMIGFEKNEHLNKHAEIMANDSLLGMMIAPMPKLDNLQIEAAQKNLLLEMGSNQAPQNLLNENNTGE